jgi:hypothetical protein
VVGSPVASIPELATRHGLVGTIVPVEAQAPSPVTPVRAVARSGCVTRVTAGEGQSGREPPLACATRHDRAGAVGPVTPPLPRSAPEPGVAGRGGG